MKNLLTVLASSVILAACVAAPNNAPTPRPHAPTPQYQPQAQQAAPYQNSQADTYRATYACRNGITANVHYFEDSAVITLDTAGQTARLAQAVSGSGANYTSQSAFYGKPAQWHVKGKSAILNFADPYGNQVETSCNEK